MKNKVLALQILIIACCLAAIVQWGVRFPYPGPLVKPFLQPTERWLEAEIREMVKAGKFDPEFWKFFTRDPERRIPPGVNIVAPADGTLQRIDRRDGKIFIVIGMSFWDVHVQRFPCDGVVTRIRDAGDTFMDGEGKDLVYLSEKVCPVQKIVSYDTRWGEFKVRLISSLSARRFEIRVREGEKVAKGRRLGRILAGSTVVLEMPQGFEILPEIGEELTAGETILWEEK